MEKEGTERETVTSEALGSHWDNWEDKERLAYEDRTARTPRTMTEGRRVLRRKLGQTPDHCRMWGHAGGNALKLMTRQTGNFRVLKRGQEKERVKFWILSPAGFLIASEASPAASQGCADSWEYRLSGQAEQDLGLSRSSQEVQ